MTDLARAQQVIAKEVAGLQALAQSLGDQFLAALDAIDAMKAKRAGRLIVAGIGKSGHVARKIAATLASTGTPAYFVHPGEASHGDMGMVTAGDIVLMLSNSGENQELSDLIHYTRRYGIPLIAMTSNPASTLAAHSDIVLCLPKQDEACPSVLAPTTSTTMMLALGDAVAVCLFQRMQLTPEQFQVFHPGGKLGQQLQRVTDLMVPYAEMAIVRPDAQMDTVILALAEKNQGCVVVADGPDTVRGIVTDGDLKRHMGPDLLCASVCDVMTTEPKAIGASQLAVEALAMMTSDTQACITSLLVRDQAGVLVGLIRLQACLQAGLG